ncbi:hypothetical protein V8D89_007280 [Ganoderma adspersum]
MHPWPKVEEKIPIEDGTGGPASGKMDGNGDFAKMTAESRFSVTHDHRSVLSQVLRNGKRWAGTVQSDATVTRWKHRIVTIRVRDSLTGLPKNPKVPWRSPGSFLESRSMSGGVRRQATIIRNIYTLTQHDEMEGSLDSIHRREWGVRRRGWYGLQRTGGGASLLGWGVVVQKCNPPPRETAARWDGREPEHCSKGHGCTTDGDASVLEMSDEAS